MAQKPPVFNSGLELASSIVESELLDKSWSSIWSLYAEVNPNDLQQQSYFKVFKQPNLTVIAFVTSPIYSPQHLFQQQQEGGGSDLVSSETLKQHNFPHLHFLCSTGNPSFSFHKHAVSGFASLFTSLQASATQLLVSRDGESVLESPVIVTGHSLGGSIASLFTLWLLDSLSQLPSKKPSKKLPIFCITFGSPLIGDKGVHGGISQRSTWNSYFLHVVSSQDPLPTLFLNSSTPLLGNPHQQKYYYKPFGTFLLSSELGCSCVEDPEVVSLLLSHKAIEFEAASNLVSVQGLPVQHYGLMVEHLKIRALCQGSSQLGLPIEDSLQAGTVLLLEAIGITPDQQQKMMNLAEKTKERLLLLMRNKRNAMEPSRKLNEIKIKLVLLGRYKRECRKKGVGYYDSYKNQWTTADIDIARHKKHLTNYWKEIVEEAEKKPQKEGSHVRVSRLYGGTTYRRMVEPLDIADFYRGTNGNKRDYKNQGRSKHYILLEKWLQEDSSAAADSSMKNNKKNRVADFTEDSCFWANVEEARISCRLLKVPTTDEGEKRVSEGYLLWFEEYVMELIRNNGVDPDIFLGKSSFMKWWAEFQEIVGNNHTSSLAGFMRSGIYRRYGSEQDS
ncbi:Senescence-associated carboxylesterase 101 [Linum grandiflorum]